MNFHRCEVEKVWPLVRHRALPFLEGIAGGEDLFLRECRDGRVICFSTVDGFLALSLAPSPDGGNDLFVRMAVSFAPTTNAVEQHLPFVERVARDMKARTIRFRSARRGWERALTDRWSVAHVEYQTEVQP